LENLQALDRLLVAPTVTKLIHNAQFESQVLGQYGLSIEPVVDTMHLSRNARGHDASGGHSLAAVCQRELGVTVCKKQQTSDWTRRPLDVAQIAYAALDAEVLLQLFARLS
jgi:ribonuclease D